MPCHAANGTRLSQSQMSHVQTCAVPPPDTLAVGFADGHRPWVPLGVGMSQIHHLHASRSRSTHLHCWYMVQWSCHIALHRRENLHADHAGALVVARARCALALRYCLAKALERCMLVLQALELLAGHMAQWSCHIAFPEMAHLSMHHLRKFVKQCPVERFRAAARSLLDVAQRNSAWLAQRRSSVDFSPKDAKQIADFLQSEKAAGQVRPLAGSGPSISCTVMCQACILGE